MKSKYLRKYANLINYSEKRGIGPSATTKKVFKFTHYLPHKIYTRNFVKLKYMKCHLKYFINLVDIFFLEREGEGIGGQ